MLTTALQKNSNHHHNHLKITFDDNTTPMDLREMLSERDRRACRLNFRTKRTKFRAKFAK